MNRPLADCIDFCNFCRHCPNVVQVALSVLTKCGQALLVLPHSSFRSYCNYSELQRVKVCCSIENYEELRQTAKLIQ